ncbi:MAG: FAD-dependent oxidoreductase [bacterium]
MDDIIIIGAGPAGMTAAVYATRKKLAVRIISDNIGGQALYSSGVENYLGYKYITGEELVQKFEEHMKSFDIKQEYVKATGVRQKDGGFVVTTDRSGEFEAKTLIVASGKIPRRLGVPGEKEFANRGVAYCSTCDGPMFAGMDVAVVGGGNSGFDAAVQLVKIASKVYVIEFGERIIADEVYQDHIKQASNAEVRTNTAVKEILGDKFVKAIKVEDRKSGAISEIPVGGIFVEIGWRPTVDFLNGLVALNKIEEIEIDCACRTSEPGIFAAGDVTNVPEKQIIISAGEGAKAALSAYDYIVRGGI